MSWDRTSPRTCPVCKNAIRLVDATSPLSYGGAEHLVHFKCRVENEELFTQLQLRYPGISLEEALARFRSGSDA
jgi:hypothetical protein